MIFLFKCILQQQKKSVGKGFQLTHVRFSINLSYLSRCKLIFEMKYEQYY